MDTNQLKNDILNFTLNDSNIFSLFFKGCADHGYSRVLLQLFGYTGHGKSAFINSCKYVLEDTEELIPYAEAENKQGGMTMIRKAYELTKNITIVDNRGYNFMNSFQRAEIYAQLGNFIPIADGEKVEWSNNYSAMMNKFKDAELNPNYSDFIVPILVYSAIHSFTTVDKKELKTFIQNCAKMTGVVPIIVITNKTSGDFIESDKAFQRMAAEVTISIENYTKKDQIKTQGRTTDILTIIHSALTDVRYRLGQERNAWKDWVERRTFLLEYIHNADQEKSKEQWGIEEEEKKRQEKRQNEEVQEEESQEENRQRTEDERRYKHNSPFIPIGSKLRMKQEKDLRGDLLQQNTVLLGVDVVIDPDQEKKKEERRQEEEKKRQEERRQEEEKKRQEERRQEAHSAVPTGRGLWWWLWRYW